jgi:hypothetical protein
MSDVPTAEELLPYVQGLRTKRLRKKFLKRPGAYVGKWVPQSVFFEWFGRVLVQPMLHQMRDDSWARKILVAEPIETPILSQCQL